MGLAFITGPVTGGIVGAQFGSRVVFIACLIITCVNLLFTQVFVQESSEKNATLSSITWNKISPIAAFSMVYSSPMMLRLGIITFLFYSALWGVIGNLMIFATTAFDYTPKECGILLSQFGLLNTLSQVFLVPVLVRYLSEVRILQLGLVAGILLLLFLGIAWTGWVLNVAMVFGAFSMLTFTAVSSLTSVSVPPSRQAEAQGAINGIKAFTEGIGPVLTGSLLATFQGSSYPGFPFILTSLLCCGALCTSLSLSSPKEIKDMGILGVKNSNSNLNGMEHFELKELLHHVVTNELFDEEDTNDSLQAAKESSQVKSSEP